MYQGLVYTCGIPASHYLLVQEGNKWHSVTFVDDGDIDWLLSRRRSTDRPWIVVNKVWLLWALQADLTSPLVIYDEQGPSWWWPNSDERRRAATTAAATLYCCRTHLPLPHYKPNTLILPNKEVMQYLLPEGLPHTKFLKLEVANG